MHFTFKSLILISFDDFERLLEGLDCEFGLRLVNLHQRLAITFCTEMYPLVKRGIDVKRSVTSIQMIFGANVRVDSGYGSKL